MGASGLASIAARLECCCVRSSLLALCTKISTELREFGDDDDDGDASPLNRAALNRAAKLHEPLADPESEYGDERRAALRDEGREGKRGVQKAQMRGERAREGNRRRKCSVCMLSSRALARALARSFHPQELPSTARG